MLFSAQNVIAVMSIAEKPLASSSLNEICSNATLLVLESQSYPPSMLVPLRRTSALTASQSKLYHSSTLSGQAVKEMAMKEPEH